jgi:hypothetical protein
VTVLLQKKELRRYWETTPLKEHVDMKMSNYKRMRQVETARTKRMRIREAKK